jgi:PPK2 family polyphosphate:nucleotide phosphotransferase
MNRYRVNPGDRIDLNRWDPNDKSLCPEGKGEGDKRLLRLNRELEELQELLFAQHEHKILVVLQAMDTGGKDGTIRHVFEGVNPQGVRVASFRTPTPEELDRDYLWRVHRQTPAKGEIVIFNRSHYEDVLVVRVHQLVPESVWSRRFEHINAFERLLADEGTRFVKFFLHIDLKEQKKRLQERLDDPKKHWKFNPGDLDERKRWDEYRLAYEDLLGRTSTPWAPWYVVPANRKWYRNLVVASVLVDLLKGLNLHYPKARFDPATIRIE